MCACRVFTWLLLPVYESLRCAEIIQPIIKLKKSGYFLPFSSECCRLPLTVWVKETKKTGTSIGKTATILDIMKATSKTIRFQRKNRFCLQ